MLIYGVVFKSLYVDYPDGIELTLFVFFMALINLVEHIIFIVFHLELLEILLSNPPQRVYKWVVPRFRVFYCSQAVTINQTSLDGGNDSSFLGLSSNEFLELFCNVDLEPFFPAFNKFVHFLLNDE